MGGSFNPAHSGHLDLSRHAFSNLRLHEVWWLVSPQNPLKAAAGTPRLAARLAAARRLARDPRIRVSDIEARLGTVYTVDSLRALRASYPGLRLVWLMGADNMVQISSWRAWEAIFEEVPVAVFDRPSYAEAALGGVAARRFARHRVDARKATTLADRRAPAWTFLSTPLNPASATAIRAARAAGPGPKCSGRR